MLYRIIFLIVLWSSPLWLFLIVYFTLAPRNKFFTIIKEGQAKLIFKAGQLVKTLIQKKGHTIDQATGKVIEGEERHLFGGLRFYGLWPLYDVVIYDFQWTNVDHEGRIIIHEKEPLDYVLLKDDVYWAKVEKAEDLNLLPLDVEITLTIRIINPSKAIFGVQNWLETIINRVKPAVRDSITNQKFEDLIKNGPAIGEEIYRKLDERALLFEFENSYGVDLKAIEVKDINPPKEYREATLKEFLAEQERKRIVIEADAERQKREIVVKGEKKRIESEYKIIEKFGDLGKLLRTLEAVEKSPLAASLQVQAVPGLQNLFSSLYGKDDVSKDEIKKLREEIEKLKEIKEENK